MAAHRIGSTAALLLALVAAWATAGPPAKAQLTLSLSLSATEVAIGDPLTATVTVRNSGQATRRAWAGSYPQPGTHLVVTRSEGGLVRYEGEMSYGDGEDVALAPGQELVYTFDVGELFALDAPGAYVVRGYNGESSGGEGVIFSEPVKFRVTEGVALFWERVTWPEERGARIHELRLLKGSAGVTAVYHQSLEGDPQQDLWRRLGKVEPASRLVLLVDAHREAHVLLRTSKELYSYLLFRPGSLARQLVPIERDRRGIWYPPQLCKDTQGKVFLRPAARPAPEAAGT